MDEKLLSTQSTVVCQSSFKC